MGLIDDLKSLEELHTKGRLSDEEFAAAKAAAISGSNKPAPSPTVPAAAPARAIAPVEPPKQKSKAAMVIWRLIGVVVLVWLLWAFFGRPSITTIKQAVNLPADVMNDTFGLRAASWRSTPIRVPYNGSLTISVQVTRGNPVRVFLTNQEGVNKFRDTKQGTYFGGFYSDNTKSFDHTDRLQPGQYYLVVYDSSLGILSSPSSDISVKAHIDP